MDCSLMLLIYFLLLIKAAVPTIDTNLAEFQYIANHLTEEECRRLIAALHFESFELPKQINSAERKLPQDTNCLELLLQWNSTPKEGKGKTHVEITHRLTQIGRDDLAQWLSKTVFHEISKDLKNSLNAETTEMTPRLPNVTVLFEDEEIEDEAAWGKLDSILSIIIVFGLTGLIGGGVFLCCLWCFVNEKKPKHNYERLPTGQD